MSLPSPICFYAFVIEWLNKFHLDQIDPWLLLIPELFWSLGVAVEELFGYSRFLNCFGLWVWQLKKHLVTASYVSTEMDNLNEKAKHAGVTLLCEMGLDPGIGLVFSSLSNQKISDLFN
jgi:hypothetical protein